MGFRQLVRHLSRQANAVKPETPLPKIADVHRRLKRHAEAIEDCEPGHSDYFSVLMKQWDVPMMLLDLAALGKSLEDR